MKIADILDRNTNLAEKLSDEELKKIGQTVLDDFNTDKLSRLEWETRTEESLKLALQAVEAKNTPWPGASNVKLPLLTIACLQFSSRVYPALVSGTDIVRMRTIGADPEGQKAARAERVSKHMSYQVLEEDEPWEEEMDRLLITMPIIGCAFKKTYFDNVRGHNVSEHVMAKDLVVNYYAKSLETAQSVTHIIPMYRNKLEERFRSGAYREIELSDPKQYDDALSHVKDDIHGQQRPKADENTPFDVLEQHCYLDLDDDGYKEPYVVSVLRDTGEVFRIVPRFREKDITFTRGRISSIKARHHFTKYPFIPSPDGGFYDLGFGVLLGPLNRSADTIINQLIDAGTLANKGGGWIGRGARLKGGEIKFKLGQYVQVNTTGTDLKNSIVPFPVKEPSTVLFSLLGYLVEYAERLSSVTDMMVGKPPGQNTPATTAMATLEEGMKVFTAIYKRVYRSLKEEFRKNYRLNQEYLNPESYFTVLDTGQNTKVFQNDYHGDPTDIRPSADPSIVSDAQKMMRAEALSQRAAAVPGYNQGLVEIRYLEAMNIEGIGEIFDPNVQPPPDPKMELESAKLELKAQDMNNKHEREMAKIDILMLKNEYEILKLESESINLLADAESKEAGIQMGEYKDALDGLRLRKEILGEIYEQRKITDGSGGMGGMEGSAPNEGSTEILV